uniref:Solute carrier family 38 member 4 n=1 Tax=Sphenodon punctatus TaxID=8508 RepID=A0A8D0GRI3_SPHPU
MELQKVNIELDDESNSGESIEDSYAEIVDPEKATISSQFVNDDAESQKFLTNGFLGKRKLEDYKEEYLPGTTSLGMSSFNLSNAIMGSGILGLSYAMANTGIILFVLGKEVSLIKRLILSCGFSLTCMVFFVSVVIYKKSQIPCPLPVLDNGVGNWTYNNTVPMHLVILPNESANSGVNFMMDSTHGHTKGLEEAKDTLRNSGVKYEAHGDNSDKCEPKYFIFNSRTAYAIPILAFAFVCHPEVLPIYSELKDRSRRRMQNVSNISICFCQTTLCLSELTLFFLFVGEVEDELLHTYTKVYTFDTLLLMVRLAVLVAVTLTVPIVLFPVSKKIICI